MLDYLHTREPVVIFRDLKPSNVMRTPAGRVYLIDFGIARLFTPGKLKGCLFSNRQEMQQRSVVSSAAASPNSPPFAMTLGF